MFLVFYSLSMTDKFLSMEAPKGIAPNFIAPFSGQLSTNAVTEALAKLPAALNELLA